MSTKGIAALLFVICGAILAAPIAMKFFVKTEFSQINGSQGGKALAAPVRTQASDYQQAVAHIVPKLSRQDWVVASFPTTFGQPPESGWYLRSFGTSGPSVLRFEGKDFISINELGMSQFSELWIDYKDASSQNQSLPNVSLAYVYPDNLLPSKLQEFGETDAIISLGGYRLVGSTSDYSARIRKTAELFNSNSAFYERSFTYLASRILGFEGDENFYFKNIEGGILIQRRLRLPIANIESLRLDLNNCNNFRSMNLRIAGEQTDRIVEWSEISTVSKLDQDNNILFVDLSRALSAMIHSNQDANVAEVFLFFDGSLSNIQSCKPFDALEAFGFADGINRNSVVRLNARTMKIDKPLNANRLIVDLKNLNPSDNWAAFIESLEVQFNASASNGLVDSKVDNIRFISEVNSTGPASLYDACKKLVIEWLGAEASLPDLQYAECLKIYDFIGFENVPYGAGMSDTPFQTENWSVEVLKPGVDYRAQVTKKGLNIEALIHRFGGQLSLSTPFGSSQTPNRVVSIEINKSDSILVKASYDQNIKLENGLNVISVPDGVSLKFVIEAVDNYSGEHDRRASLSILSISEKQLPSLEDNSSRRWQSETADIDNANRSYLNEGSKNGASFQTRLETTTSPNAQLSEFCIPNHVASICSIGILENWFVDQSGLTFNLLSPGTVRVQRKKPLSLPANSYVRVELEADPALAPASTKLELIDYHGESKIFSIASGNAIFLGKNPIELADVVLSVKLMGAKNSIKIKNIAFFSRMKAQRMDILNTSVISKYSAAMQVTNSWQLPPVSIQTFRPGNGVVVEADLQKVTSDSRVIASIDFESNGRESHLCDVKIHATVPDNIYFEGETWAEISLTNNVGQKELFPLPYSSLSNSSSDLIDVVQYHQKSGSEPLRFTIHILRPANALTTGFPISVFSVSPKIAYCGPMTLGEVARRSPVLSIKGEPLSMADLTSDLPSLPPSGGFFPLGKLLQHNTEWPDVVLLNNQFFEVKSIKAIGNQSLSMK